MLAELEFLIALFLSFAAGSVLALVGTTAIFINRGVHEKTKEQALPEFKAIPKRTNKAAASKTKTAKKRT